MATLCQLPSAQVRLPTSFVAESGELASVGILAFQEARARPTGCTTGAFLVAVDPPAKSLTFGGFSGKHLYFPKSQSLKIQPNSSQALADSVGI